MAENAQQHSEENENFPASAGPILRTYVLVGLLIVFCGVASFLDVWSVIWCAMFSCDVPQSAQHKALPKGVEVPLPGGYGQE